MPHFGTGKAVLRPELLAGVGVEAQPPSPSPFEHKVLLSSGRVCVRKRRGKSCFGIKGREAGEERGGLPGARLRPGRQPVPSSLGVIGCFPRGLSASTDCRGRAGRVPRASLLSPMQILLNYLPVERASWTSILAKQR